MDMEAHSDKSNGRLIGGSLRMRGSLRIIGGCLRIIPLPREHEGLPMRTVAAFVHHHHSHVVLFCRQYGPALVPQPVHNVHSLCTMLCAQCCAIVPRIYLGTIVVQRVTTRASGYGKRREDRRWARRQRQWRERRVTAANAVAGSGLGLES